MSEVKRLELAPGVHLTAVRTHKFKSAVLGIYCLTPLKKETASANALVPYVLRRGTQRKPDMNALSEALDELYGGSVEPLVRKKGETQCVGLVGSFLDDAYTLNGERILEEAVGLMGELLLRPHTEQGVFSAAYTQGERENLIHRIRAQINDKRQYSMKRLVELMCRDEAYGVDRLGREEEAAALDEKTLWAAYENLLRQAKIELYYCGSADAGRVADLFRGALETLPMNEERVALTCQVKERPDHDTPQYVEEAMDVAQGKLAMGFRTGGVCLGKEDYPALAVFNALFGGTTTSKLFMNVREKLSLCYFASSGLEKLKGVLLVSTGIEFENAQKAREEIMNQLEVCRRGEIEDWEMAGAVRGIVSDLQTIRDSQSRLEDFWLGQAAAGLTDGPEALIEQVERVTREEVAQMAARVALDTVYFLKGQEGDK